MFNNKISEIISYYPLILMIPIVLFSIAVISYLKAILKNTSKLTNIENILDKWYKNKLGVKIGTKEELINELKNKSLTFKKEQELKLKEAQLKFKKNEEFLNKKDKDD